MRRFLFRNLAFMSFVVGFGVVACRPAAVQTPADVTTCHVYDPTKLAVSAPDNFYAAQQWKIESAGVEVERAANQADAEQVMTLASFYTQECRIGSSKTPPTFWKGPVKPLALPFQEDCIDYDPSRIEYAISSLPVAGAVSLKSLFAADLNQTEADALLAIARRATRACVIGGRKYLPSGAQPRGPLTKQDRFDSEAAQETWHPVYYWK
jgi:hypothetical protein